jgi:hypothetical protein
MLAELVDSFRQWRWDELPAASSWLVVAAWAVLVPFLTLVAWRVISYSRSPLRRYPGPFLAGTLRAARSWPWPQ